MTLATLRALTRTRLDDVNADVYADGEILAALNAGQRIFALLTLSIERERVVNFASLQQWRHLLDVLTDFIVPLRVRVRQGVAQFDGMLWDDVPFDSPGGTTRSQGDRIRPATVTDFRAASSTWLADTGDAKRYAMLGVDLILLDRASPAAVNLAVKYAALPVDLANDIDVPEIPDAHHEQLANFAPFWLRVREGGSVHAETKAGLDEFMQAAKQLGGYVRARSLSQRYDRTPAEFTLADASRDPMARGDLKTEAPA